MAEWRLFTGWPAEALRARLDALSTRSRNFEAADEAAMTGDAGWHHYQSEAVIAVVRANVALSRRVIRRLAAALPRTTAELPYPQALRDALITDPAKIPPETRRRLDLIVGHYLRS